MEIPTMDIMSIKDSIKVVINNRNRLTTTKNMVDKLLSINPNEPIIILDNSSSYVPLMLWYKDVLENPFYKSVNIHFHKNEGHLALWNTGLHKDLGEYFVYTDSDIQLNEHFPNDWKEIMLNQAIKYDTKIALAIRIDDIPDHYRYKNQVIRNESGWWKKEVEPNLFEADTDTTFSLMRNFGDNQFKSLRIAREDMLARHIPWYHDLDNLDDEEKYYLNNMGSRVLTQYSKQHLEPEKYTDI